MKKILTFLILLTTTIIPKFTYAQKGGDYSLSNPNQIIRDAKPLIYYGVDFSHVRISDGKKVSKNKVYSSVYPPAWITYIEKEMPPVDYVQHILRIDSFYYKQEEIYPVSISVFPDFITGAPYSFPIDTVKGAIRRYNLSQKSGTGMVLIPENFNKPKEIAISWFVLFDIQKREIIYSTKIIGHCGHMGYTAHWGSGVVSGFKNFIKNTLK